MMAVGIILWVMFLAWLVGSLYPSEEMHRDPAGNGVYYAVWVLLFISVVLGQYHLMAQSRHTVLALMSDLVGIGLGTARCWLMWRCWHDGHDSDGHTASSQFLHTYRP